MAAAATKPWFSTLLVVVLAVMFIAAKPAAADDDDGAACSSKHLPKECAADVFSSCKRVRFPFSLLFRSCNLEGKVRVCCEELKEMKMRGHRCAKCALLKEFDAVPRFDPAKCDNDVQHAVAECKYCEANPTDEARCKNA